MRFDNHGNMDAVVPDWGESDRCPLTGYVRGEYDDSCPLAAVLWADIRRAYRRNRIPGLHAAMFEARCIGESYRRIGETFGCHHATAAKYVRQVRAALEADPELGLLTTIVEQCGGWRVVADVIF